MADRKRFVHLHTHTEFSMLDGASRVDELVAAAATDGQPALGITDHGNMYGRTNAATSGSTRAARSTTPAVRAKVARRPGIT